MYPHTWCTSDRESIWHISFMLFYVFICYTYIRFRSQFQESENKPEELYCSMRVRACRPEKMVSAEWLVQSLGLFSTCLHNQLELLFCSSSKVENIDQPKLMLGYLEPACPNRHHKDMLWLKNEGAVSIPTLSKKNTPLKLTHSPTHAHGFLHSNGQFVPFTHCNCAHSPQTSHASHFFKKNPKNPMFQCCQRDDISLVPLKVLFVLFNCITDLYAQGILPVGIEPMYCSVYSHSFLFGLLFTALGLSNSFVCWRVLAVFKNNWVWKQKLN